MQQIQQQLQRIGTLVGIKHFDSARMQLREGPTSGLRRTLREMENDFVGVSDSVISFDFQASFHGQHAALVCSCATLMMTAGLSPFLPQHAGFP
jgi:hypothetical protein